MCACTRCPIPLPLRRPTDRLTGLQGNKTKKAVLGRFEAIRVNVNSPITAAFF